MPYKGYKQTEEHKINTKLASRDNVKKRLKTMKERNSFYRPFGNLNPMKNPLTRKKSSEARKGKTYEQMYGIDIAKQKKLNMSNILKGKSYEDLMGKEKATKLIKLRRLMNSKENNNSWLGGISKKNCKHYNDILFLKEIRKRDNDECMLCRIHREKLNKNLDVHHINYIETEDTFENCITLCHSCHQKTNFNRGHWFEMFKNILSEKYGYSYLNNIKIIKYNNKEVKYETQ